VSGARCEGKTGTYSVEGITWVLFLLSTVTNKLSVLILSLFQNSEPILPNFSCRL
jgi:hypothetical protein